MDFFSRDLTELAKQGTLGNFHGREKVLQLAVTVLALDGKSNVVFTGEPGVGKTAVVEALALRIATGKVPDSLRNASIQELDVNALAAGTMYRGQFEEKAKALVDYLLAHPNVIVFMDELHSILGVGSYTEQPSPFANFLKPHLASGKIRMIGATTNREFDAMDRKDPAFARRFTRIKVPEPSRDEAIGILRLVAEPQAKKAGLILGDGVVEAAVDLSNRFIHDRRLPDKAIDLLIGCIGAKTAVLASGPPKDVSAPPKMLELIDRELAAIEHQDWTAASLLVTEWFKNKSGSSITLTVKDLQKLVSERFGGMDSGDPAAVQKVLDLESKLRAEVIGQDRAIQAVCSAMKRMMALGRSVRPIGSFLFLGPTGVGKTELCKAVARQLWGESALLQYNMSEYMDTSGAAKLIGAAPGLVGNEEGGRLVRDVACKPSSVVLFDEIEKAHVDIPNLLLQILEEGKLQDGTGKVCSFSQTLVILTSNIAADWIAKLPKRDLVDRYDDVQQQLRELLKQQFRPELVNRIDEIVIFAPLEYADLERILTLLLAEKNRQQKENTRPLIELTQGARTLVIEKGFDPSLGARPLRHALDQLVMSEVADYILDQTMSGSLSANTVLLADAKAGRITITAREQVRA
jgi:ATP-dependent Clp protease ATP-binding subunit ClpC